MIHAREKRNKETKKRASERDKTRLEALQTKAFRDFLKERTQSDTLMCYDDSVDKEKRRTAPS